MPVYYPEALSPVLFPIFLCSTGIDLNASSKQVKGTAEAFSFIQDQAYGKYLLGFVAAGLVCYGLFMFSTAAYRKYND